jgi:Lysozyme like domain
MERLMGFLATTSVTLPDVSGMGWVLIASVVGLVAFVALHPTVVNAAAMVWSMRRPLVVLLALAVAVSVGRSMTVHVATPPAATTFSAPVPAPDYATAPAGPGVVYSYEQLSGALTSAGVPAASANVGAAIAEAESGGRSDAVHLCPPRCDPGQGPEASYGPFQINLIGRSWITPACAEALACSANGASRISGRGSNWTPWTTYTSRAYRRYLR